MREISTDELTGQFAALGVARGGVLLVHASFSVVRPVEGGPAGLIAALRAALGPEGTLVMPSWPDDAEALFDPDETDAATGLGIVARTFWRMPGVLRSPHVQAFAAAGPDAARILCDPLPLPPHGPPSPVGRVYELDGQVLLLGVNHDADTTIHLAELLASVPYGVRKRCLALVDGRPRLIEYRENDHCCERFRLADDWLRASGEQSEGRVGHATARLVRSRAVVDAVRNRLECDPLLFLHPPAAGCAECDEARASLV